MQNHNLWQIQVPQDLRFTFKTFQDFLSILTWHRLYIIYSGLLFLNYLISQNLAAKNRTDQLALPEYKVN